MANTEAVFGLHAVQTLLKSAPQRVHELLVLQGRHDHRLQKVLQVAQQHEIPVRRVSRKELDKLVEGNHQGVVVFSEPGDVYDEAFLERLLNQTEATPFLLVLDGVTDPHNLGACLRSAEAAGVQAVIVPKDRSVGLNATVCKVACGAAEVLPLVAVTNLSRVLATLQQRGVWTVGAAGEAQHSVYQVDLKGPLALVMGAEGKGLRRLTREHCDSLVNIPMLGTAVSSLNVSVATGICLFEAVRQRKA